MRHHYMDWLRVFVILNLIPFHAAWLMTCVPGFSTMSWESSGALTGWIYVSFFSWWQMPLLFFVSGMSTHYALTRKSISAYSLERIFRLLIPLVFFMLFLWQPLAYFWPSGFSGRSAENYFLVFWPGSLKTILYNDYSGGPQWAHMWFVAYLLIYTFALLPVFGLLNKRGIQGFRIRATSSSAQAGIIILTSVPFIVCYFFLEPFFPGHKNNLYTDWSYFFFNMIAYISGYSISQSENFLKIVDRFRFILVAFSVVLSILIIYIIFFSGKHTDPAYSLPFFGYAILYGLNAWMWMLALLGLFRRYLNFSNNSLKYLNRASYPFYIIHLVVMVVIGYYITRMEFSPLMEFFLIVLLSFFATFICYELVKRWSITRILFGIK